MNIAFRPPLMNRDAFFAWAEAQDDRYEFDGLQPVAMTGGTLIHARLTVRLLALLAEQLQGGSCEVLGPDAGLATIGNAVRYPDVMIACAKGADQAQLAPGVVVVFEVLSPTSGRTDRFVKAREYQAVASILCYVIVEYDMVGLTVLHRSSGDLPWTASMLAGGDTLRLQAVGASLGVDDIYATTGLAQTDAGTPG